MAVLLGLVSGCRRVIAVVVVVTMALGLVACGGRGRDAEAQELADSVLPGQLRVLSTAVDWYPVAGGMIPTPHTSAVYAIIDDPDAVVRIDDLQAEKLRDAVAAARVVAGRFRALEAAMRSVGVGVVGFAADRAYLTIDLSPGNVPAGRTRLDQGLTAWHSALVDLPDGPPTGSFSLQLVRSDVALPDAKDRSAPRLAQWSASARMKALTAATEHQAHVHLEDDGVEPVANSLQPALSSSQRDEVRKAVQSAAESVVGTPTGPVQWTRSFYLTDDLDHVRMYCFLVRGRGVIAVTVSLPEFATSEVAAIDLDGPIPRTLEPELIPG